MTAEELRQQLLTTFRGRVADADKAWRNARNQNARGDAFTVKCTYQNVVRELESIQL